MKQDKSSLDVEKLHTLCECTTVIANRPATECDVRTLLRATGISAVAQSELTAVLKKGRERFGTTPLDRITRSLAVVPEGLMEAVANVLDSFIAERVSNKYRADTEAIIKLRQELAEAHQAVDELKLDLEACEDKCQRLRLDHATAAEACCLATERVEMLEKERFAMEGRNMQLMDIIAVNGTKAEQKKAKSVATTAGSGKRVRSRRTDKRKDLKAAVSSDKKARPKKSGGPEGAEAAA